MWRRFISSNRADHFFRVVSILKNKQFLVFGNNSIDCEITAAGFHFLVASALNWVWWSSCNRYRFNELQEINCKDFQNGGLFPGLGPLFLFQSQHAQLCTTRFSVPTDHHRASWRWRAALPCHSCLSARVCRANICSDGWMDWQMDDGWMDGRMNGWMDGWTRFPSRS